jgi:hypothetical protein
MRVTEWQLMQLRLCASDSIESSPCARAAPHTDSIASAASVAAYRPIEIMMVSVDACPTCFRGIIKDAAQ